MFFNKKILALSIAGVLSLNVSQANAALINLEITGSTSATADANNDSDSDTSDTDVYVSSSTYSASSEGRATAAGDDSGWFYSTAGGYGNFTASSLVSQAYTVENNSNVEQFFDFSFEVMNGSISATCGGNAYGNESELFAFDDGYGGACTGDDFASANYMAEIFLDGNSIWNSAAIVIG